MLLQAQGLCVPGIEWQQALDTGQFSSPTEQAAGKRDPAVFSRQEIVLVGGALSLACLRQAGLCQELSLFPRRPAQHPLPPGEVLICPLQTWHGGGDAGGPLMVPGWRKAPCMAFASGVAKALHDFPGK